MKSALHTMSESRKAKHEIESSPINHSINQSINQLHAKWYTFFYCRYDSNCRLVLLRYFSECSYNRGLMWTALLTCHTRCLVRGSTHSTDVRKEVQHQSLSRVGRRQSNWVINREEGSLSVKLAKAALENLSYRLRFQLALFITCFVYINPLKADVHLNHIHI